MRMLIFVCALLFTSATMAKTMRVCVPHDAPPDTRTAPGLREIHGIDYKALCGKNGVTCKPVKGESYGFKKMDCFVMRASGKQLDFPAPKPNLGPENPAILKIAPVFAK